jgi:hypothetical protein
MGLAGRGRGRDGYATWEGQALLATEPLSWLAKARGRLSHDGRRVATVGGREENGKFFLIKISFCLFYEF